MPRRIQGDWGAPRKVTLTKDRSRDVYQARITKDGITRKFTFGSDYAKAREAFYELMDDLRTGKLVVFSDAVGGPTIEELQVAFLHAAERDIAQATFKQYKSLLGDFCERHKDRYARNITAADVDAEKTRLTKAGRKMETVNHVVKAIKRMFNWSVEVDLLEVSPIAKVKKIKFAKEKKGRPLTEDEIEKMLKTSEAEGQPELRDAIVVLLETGMRIGELASLSANEVDFEKRLIRIPKTADKTASTTTRQRLPIKMSPNVHDILQNRRNQEGLLFKGARSGPFNKDAAGKLWNKIRDKAGLDKNLTIHCLRHTFITRAILAGVTYEQLEPITGNSARIMREYYAEWTETSAADVMDRIASGFIRRANGSGSC